MREKLYIVGVGPGNRELLSSRTLDAMQSADRVMGTPRVAMLHGGCLSFSLSEMLRELKLPFSGTTAVLVGGDCCFFSAASQIVREFSNRYEIEQINGIGSIPYFASRIGISYDDAVLISLHGRTEHIVPRVSYNKKVFALTGGSAKAQDICNDLCVAGLTETEIVVGEKLSYPDERIVHGTPALLKGECFDDLSVIFIGNENAVDPHFLLRDADFIRSEEHSARIPMTKEEIRWLTLAKLAISPKDIVYDIGAGSGSVAVEAARKAFEGIVYAVDANENACRLVEKNRICHGAYNVHVRHGFAPDCLVDLPRPDKAFIGGGNDNAETIVKVLLEKNPAVRIVANAVSLQGLYRILDAFEAYRFTEIETVCVNVAKSKRIKQHDLMIAQNPVYIITGSRGERCES